MMWHATKEIARKEILQMLRTKRLLGLGITILVAMILLTMVLPLVLINAFGAAETFGGPEARDAAEEGAAAVPYLHNGVMLFFLGAGVLLVSGYGLFELLAIVMTSDAVSSEWSKRSIFLVLSKPVPRAAFVLGKFLGIGVPLALLTGALLSLDYLIVSLVVPGWPAAHEVGRFFGAVGLIMMGVIMWTAISLFFSTAFRSTVTSLLLTVVAWFIVFPILGLLGAFIGLSTGSLAFQELNDGTWSTYLNPKALMVAAGGVLIPEVGGFAGLFGAIGSAGLEWWDSLIAMVAHTAFFLVASLFIVQFRNFE